jgi:hypothetical protein
MDTIELFSSYMDARQLSSVTLPSYPRSPLSQPQHSKHSEHPPVTKQGETCSLMVSDRRHTSSQNSVPQCGVFGGRLATAHLRVPPSLIRLPSTPPGSSFSTASCDARRWLLDVESQRQGNLAARSGSREGEQRRSLIEARCSAGYAASLSPAGVV